MINSKNFSVSNRKGISSQTIHSPSNGIFLLLNSVVLFEEDATKSRGNTLTNRGLAVEGRKDAYHGTFCGISTCSPVS
jgi:hypothetical protein